MYTKYCEKTHKNEWVCDHWYEKVYFIVGAVFTLLMVISFIIGFINGVISSL